MYIKEQILSKTFNTYNIELERKKNENKKVYISLAVESLNFRMY